MKAAQVRELLLQGLQTEQGGMLVYETALTCVQNDELKEEWTKYLQQTRRHVEIMQDLCVAFRVDPEQMTPGREVVRHHGHSLVQAMEMARKAGPEAAAELVATECVVLAETKDHLNWELLSLVKEKASGKEREALRAAIEEVEEEEDEHLYHSTGWSRELWIQSLGLAPVLPPPEEQKDVKTAIGAARAKMARKEMV